MRLSIVIPCYNEEAVLSGCVERVTQLLQDLQSRGKVSAGSNLWLVDDGSRDGTWSLIEAMARQHPDVTGVKLSRNRGHQNALLAGLMSADGDAVISLDADLQDDLAVIEEMLDVHRSGAQVVFGVRRSRKQDTFFKRWSARRYYALLRILGVEVVPDHAEFRLLGRAAITALSQYPETNLFLRGLVPQLGFPTARVLYDRQQRLAGETKYPLTRMLGLAIDGVTSFSAVPLRMIAAIGALLFLLSMAVSIWVLGVKLFTSHAVPGWASTTLPIYALGGVQLLSLGLVGEYVAKIYVEVKRRPRYIIECMTSDRQMPPK